MKVLVVLLALVAVALGGEFQEILEAKERSVSSQVVDAIEAFRDQMPCGFDSLGLGPLSPAKLSHKEINIDSGTFAAHGEINDFTLYGLDDFEIVEFKINLITRKVTFKFHWNNVNFATLYRMMMNLGGSLDVNMLREDKGKFAVKGFTLWGSLKYTMFSSLSVKEFKAYCSVDEVKSELDGLSGNKYVNKMFNSIIEEWIMLAINDNTDAMGELVNDLAVPMMNNMIGDRSLSDLIGMIGGGGGGGSGAEPVEKVPCVAPPAL